MLRRHAKPAPAQPSFAGAADDSHGALFVPIRIELDLEPGTHTVTHGDNELLTVEAETARRLEVVTILRADEWAAHRNISIAAPNRVVRATPDPVRSTGEVRPFEDEDVVSAADVSTFGLGRGWAPREFVDGAPVRWIGHRADVHLAPGSSPRTLAVAGRTGPCLGRTARIALFQGSQQLDSVPIDIEDGQDFRVAFSLGGATTPGVLTLQVERPRPRHTPHDVRVLNLLVTKVGTR